jgi:acetylornithine deacetylase/succinyl-diaminopimelate desuccinylase-like protein
MHVDVHGETAHAGPTPMDRRRNALIGAAMLAVAVNDIGWKYHVTEGKATVPRLINEAEHAEQDETAPGVNVLLHGVLAPVSLAPTRECSVVDVSISL